MTRKDLLEDDAEKLALYELVGATIKAAEFRNADWPEIEIVFEDGRVLLIHECGQAGWLGAKLYT